MSLYSIDEDGASVWATDEIAASHSPDRLYLVSYSGMSEARPVYDLLASIAFYDPSPARIHVPTPAAPGLPLRRDGENLASVFRRIQASDSETMWRFTRYLAHVTPGIEEIEAVDLGGFDSLEFRQRIGSEGGYWRARASQMSDGTLRALAVLVALFQNRLGGKSPVSLVGIEEPETGLHPAAAGVVLSAMVDASMTTQVLATTHSADMLHMGDVDINSLLAVSAETGVTTIGPIDEISRGIVRDRLFTVGELLQMDQLRPETTTHGSDSEGVMSSPSAGAP